MKKKKKEDVLDDESVLKFEESGIVVDADGKPQAWCSFLNKIFHPGFCCVRVSSIGLYGVRSSFLNKILQLPGAVGIHNVDGVEASMRTINSAPLRLSFPLPHVSTNHAARGSARGWNRLPL
jgi:hypothetical protein